MLHSLPAPAPSASAATSSADVAEGRWLRTLRPGRALPFAKDQRDRRNLTPDQLALVMGRHYNRVKQRHGGQVPGSCSEKPNTSWARTSDRLATDYGVHPTTIIGNGKFAAAVDTLRAVDPDIEAR